MTFSRVREADDLSALAVYRRVTRGGEPLTMAIVRETVAELGGVANADRVYYQLKSWLAQTAATGRRAVR